MPLDPQLAAMLEFLAGYPPMHEGSPEAARQGFRVMSVDMVKPEDVVPVVRTLLLDNTNINGQAIVIDGGGSI